MAKPPSVGIVNSWIADHSELNFNKEKSKIECSLCRIELKLSKYVVDRHLISSKHKRNGGDDSAETDFNHLFYLDLIIFVISNNIPWSRVNHPSFRMFFNKYLQPKYKLRDESYLRRNFLEVVYPRTLTEIRQLTGEKDLMISINETLDSVGRSIVNIIIQPLTAIASCTPHLICCRNIAVHAKEVSNLVQESLQVLWQDSYERNLPKFLMLCTHSAAHMLAAGKELKKTFPNLRHFTCLAHALHAMAEKILMEHRSVTTLITNFKLFLSKMIKGKEFKVQTGLVLPPQPDDTRQGTWLETALYYSDNIEKVRNFINNLDRNEASVLKVKRTLSDPSLISDLELIKETYSFLPDAIQRLERCIPIVESLQILDEVRLNLASLAPESINIEMENIINNIPDYDFIREKSETGDVNDPYKFATLTSVKIDKSYPSMYNSLKTRLTPENAEKLVVTHYYHSKKDDSLICTLEDFEDTIPEYSLDQALEPECRLRASLIID